MSWFGTDLVAVGCILGGAAVGGAATFAFMDGPEESRNRCAVEAIAMAPRVAIAHGGNAHTIVVTPDVKVRGLPGCVADVQRRVDIHLEGQMEHLEAQLEHLDRALELNLGQMEHEIQEGVEARLLAREEFKEAMRQMEEARRQVALKRAQGGGI